MAVQNPTITQVASKSYKVVWGPATDADTFTPVPTPAGYTNITAQVEGTFGGATITISGSIDGTNFEPMLTKQGTAGTFAAAGMKSYQEMPAFIRPSTAGGTASSLTVLMLFAGSNS